MHSLTVNECKSPVYNTCVMLAGVKWLSRVVLWCCLAAVGFGQQTANVPIIVVVADQATLPLKVSDLSVKVGHQPVAVASITSLAGQHLQYALVNEVRNRTRWPNGTQQQTDVASQFLNQVVAAGVDTGSLVNFSAVYYLDVRDEKEPLKVAAKLAKGDGTPIDDATAMYDALIATATYLAKQPFSPDHRKVIFLFCDGEDNQSEGSFNQATEALQRAAIPVFIVAPSSVKNEQQGKTLSKLANQTGGRAYFLPRDTRRVNFDSLKRDLAQSFLLKISISSFQGMVPVTITDVAKSKVSIIAPSQIGAPQKE